MAEEWYESRTALATFAEVLHESEQLDEIDDFLYYMVKPWKYNVEHKDWEKMGSPLPDSAKWDNYLNSLEEEVE